LGRAPGARGLQLHQRHQRGLARRRAPHPPARGPRSMSERVPALPYGRHAIDEDDIAAVASVLRGEWLTMGPTTRAFESALAERVGGAHAVSCANGTAALHLACLAAELGPGDAAIVPAIT